MSDVFFETRKFKYFTNDLFDPDSYFEISENDFDDQVVKYRSLFDFKYLDGFTVLFTLKDNPCVSYKRVCVC